MDRFKAVAIVYLVLEREGQLLLMRRANTGHEDGNYSLIAGHVDAGETLAEAMSREAWEEAGLRFEPQTLQLVHVSHRLATDERLTFFFRPAFDLPIAEPRNRESDKCDDMRWFPIDELPLNTVSYVRDALHQIQRNAPYSEFGWSARGN